MAGLLALLGSLAPNEDGTPNLMQRMSNALHPEEAALQRNQSALAKLAPRIQAGDKSALMELALVNPQAASALAQFAKSPDKIQEVGGKLIRFNPEDPNSKPEVVFDGGGTPLTELAKLKADLDAGRIDKETYDRKVAKDTAPTEKNYKQFQLQNASFADRMVNASSILDPYEDLQAKGEFDPVNLTSAALANIPSFGLGGYLGNLNLSEDQQKYKNAQEEWVRAKLRKESGAAIGEKEMRDEVTTYFPRPGDSPEVIKQKAQLRKVATDSMIKQTSGAYDDMYGAQEPTEPRKKKTISFKDLQK